MGNSSLKVYLYTANPVDFPHERIDYGILKKIFDKENIEQIKCFSLPEVDFAFVVISGQGNSYQEEKINQEIKKIKRLKFFVIADGSSNFDVSKIKHPNIEIWKQYPNKSHANYQYLPIGTPTPFLTNKHKFVSKEHLLYFSGQITNQRRQQLKNILPTIKNSVYRFSLIYTKGDSPEKYYENMAKSFITPAPSGEFILDSFRVYEAIELLSLPIIDSLNSYGEKDDFFEFVYGNIPAPRIENWNNLEIEIEKILKSYPDNLFHLVCWWIEYKINLANKILDKPLKNIIKKELVVKNFKQDTFKKIEDFIISENFYNSDNQIIIIFNFSEQEKIVFFEEINNLKFEILWNSLHKWDNVLPRC